MYRRPVPFPPPPDVTAYNRSLLLHLFFYSTLGVINSLHIFFPFSLFFLMLEPFGSLFFSVVSGHFSSMLGHRSNVSFLRIAFILVRYMLRKSDQLIQWL
jgi:hypothetical protein